TPDDGQRHALRGLALAYLGRKAEAIAEGQRGVALVPISRDAFIGAYNQHQLARIYLLVGEPAKALDHLEPLLTMPYYLSPGWLRSIPRSRPSRATRASSGWWRGSKTGASGPVARQTDAQRRWAAQATLRRKRGSHIEPVVFLSALAILVGIPALTVLEIARLRAASAASPSAAVTGRLEALE